jgi:transposase
MAAVLLPNERTPALQPLAPDLPTIGRFLERLAASGVRCCYEAGPCGFDLQRYLHAKGIACDVIAPALIPRRVGNRVKTDRRDAAQLAVLYRAGALTAIHIPTEPEEAVRDLLRCREDICTDLLRAKHRLSKFLLRHGRRCPDGRAWSKRYFAWLSVQRWPLAALEQTFTSYRRAIDDIVARLRAIDTDLQAALTVAPLAPRVARRRHALSGRAPGDGLHRPSPLGIFQRRDPETRWDHENRQRASAPGLSRSRLALSPPAGDQSSAADPAARGAGRRDPLCLERTAPTARAVSAAARARQVATARRDGRRARVVGVCVGGVDAVIGSAEMIGRILETSMRSTTAVSNSRS